MNKIPQTLWRGVKISIHAAEFLDGKNEVEYKDIAKWRGVGPAKIKELQEAGLRVYRRALVKPKASTATL